MKKLIAIAVVFALVAGAAFAVDINAGGALKAKVGGDSETKKEGIGTGYDGWFWVNFGASSEDNTAGAKAGLSINPLNASVNGGGDTWAYAFWQPIPQIFFKMGKIGEEGKYWGTAGITGWDFQSNDLFISPAFNYYNGYAGSVLGDSHGFWANGFGNDGKSAMQLSILPIEALAFNAAWDFTKTGEYDGKPVNVARSVFIDSIALQVVFEIFSINGQAAVGFVNNTKGAGKNMYAQYKMGITDDMKFEIGFHLPIPPKDGKLNVFNIGAGFGYGSPWSGTFFVNVRAGAAIGIGEGEPTKIGFDVCPSYDIEGLFRVYVPFGIGLIAPGGGGDMLFAWSVNPYIRKFVGGGVSFWAGVQFYNGHINGNRDGSWSGPWYPEVYSKDSQKIVSWAIPLGLLWSF